MTAQATEVRRIEIPVPDLKGYSLLEAQVLCLHLNDWKVGLKDGEKRKLVKDPWAWVISGHDGNEPGKTKLNTGEVLGVTLDGISRNQEKLWNLLFASVAGLLGGLVALGIASKFNWFGG